MGRGILKAKKKLKMMYLGNALKEVERLQAENQMLKTDPTSVVGKFLNEFNEVIAQNQRLSALTCSLIVQDGGKSVVTREEIDNWKGKRLRIQINTTEEEKDVKFEDAKAYVFTFTATTQEEDEAAQQAAMLAAAQDAIPECTDPECKLPKELKHRHDAPVPTPVEAATPILVSGEVTEVTPAAETQSAAE